MRGPDAEVQFALLVDRVEREVLAEADFGEKMALFRDQCGAAAMLVSEQDVELDADPIVVEDLQPHVSSVLPRVRELRERLFAARARRT